MLVVGAISFGLTVWREGPWPILLICAATMAGPATVQLWLLGRGTPDSPGSPPLGSPEPSPPSPTPLPAPPGGEV
jgi:sugar phosphate permease